MAYVPHTLITFGGDLTEATTGDEIWQCGVRGGNPTTAFAPVDPGQLQNLIDAISTPLQTWYASVKAHHPNTTHLKWIKAVNVGADGKYTTDPVVIDTLNVAGNGSSVTAPSFCSVAVSWSTGVKFGKATRGRIYPPNFATPTGVTATITTQAALDLVDAGRALLTALAQSGAEFVFEPHVMSESGPHRKITGVRVGNVWDVQRRRKNATPETYATGVWP